LSHSAHLLHSILNALMQLDYTLKNS
jgi:hypothetical protein